jgi:hypothetical protein
MPFNLKQFLKKIDKGLAPKIETLPKPESVPEVKPEPVQEHIQEISIPEYVPVEESDSDIETHLHSIVLSSTRRKNKNIDRKVSLNPLSDE